MSNSQGLPFLRNRCLVVFIIFLASFVSTFLNRHNSTQSGALIYHTRLMDFYRGVEGSEYSLYPLWGYPLALSLINNIEYTIYYQTLLGAIAASLFYLYIGNILSSLSAKLLWTSALITALPFYATIAVRWPASFQLAGIVISMTLLMYALGKNSIAASVLSGLFLGIACNFRSEYLYLSLFIPFIFFGIRLVKPSFLAPASLKHLLFFALFTWLAMIPLGMDRRANTGTFNIKVGNGDWTNVFFSIGQYPGNSLGLHFDDLWVEDYLEAHLEEPYDSSQVLHMQSVANDYSKTAFLDYLSRYPFNFMAKLLFNFKSIVTGGFYYGQIDSAISTEFSDKIIIGKELYKSLTGMNNSISNLRYLHSLGLIESVDEVTVDDFMTSRSYTALPFLLIGAVFAFVNLVFYCVLILRFFLLLRKRISITIDETLLLSCILYGNSLMMVGMYENRFASVYYLFLTAFIMLSIDSIKSFRKAPKTISASAAGRVGES